MENLVIAGAGLTGSLLALNLARAGFPVKVYEQKPDPRLEPPKSDRSVSITVAVRGFRALDAVGAGAAVRANSTPIYGRMIHNERGDCTYQPYGVAGEANHSISRQMLHRILLDAVDACPNIEVRFGMACTGIDLKTGAVQLLDRNTGSRTEIQADRLFAADGAFSTVRYGLLRQRRFDYQQKFLSHGYREITIPANPDGGPAYGRNAFHVWPRKDIVLWGFANLDGSFTFSLVMPHEGAVSNASMNSRKPLLELFRSFFPDVLPLVEPVLDENLRNPFEPMVTIQCRPWVHRDRAVLIGDAAHAILPFYGQGANAGFEDCWVLMEALREHGGDWTPALRQYETQRKVDTDTIAALCEEHFVEIMAHVASSEFHLRKEVERVLASCAPGLKPLYRNISFTCMRYSEAVKREAEYRRIVDRLLQVEGIEQKLREPAAMRAILQAHGVAAPDGLPTQE